MRRYMTAMLAVLGLALLVPAAASAAVSFSFSEAKHEGTPNRGDAYVGYSVKLKNSGSETTTAASKVALALPGGLQFVGGKGTGWSCDTTTSICSNSTLVAAGTEFPTLKLEVWVFPAAPDTVTATFTASGGGAVTPTVAEDSFSFGPKVPFGMSNPVAAVCTRPTAAVDVRSCAESEAAGGIPYTAAGGHPFMASTSFTFNTRINPNGKPAVVESLRDLFIDLPPGFLGNPQAINSICTVTQVRETTALAQICPESAAVGGLGAQLANLPTGEAAPIYRVVPEEGYVAAFAVKPVEVSALTVVIRVKVRSNGDYGVTAVSPLPPQLPEFLKVNFATLCGYGAKAQPGEFATYFPGCHYPGTPGATTIPFLTNPTSCPGSEPVTRMAIDSYPNPGAQNAEGFPVLSDTNWKLEEAKSPPTTGCNQLEFDPAFQGRPTTSVADAPSGLDFNLHLPQDGLLDKDGFATAHLRDTTVVLPPGMAVNPSAATGLDACTSAQIGLTSAVGATPVHFSGLPDNCPAASKMGTVEVTTPVLDKRLMGSLYLAKQFDNPFNSLLALYIAVADPETGVVVKLAGRVTPDPVTGRITTSFSENPQVPFEDLELKVFEGPRGALRTPPTCGPKATEATFTPWSAPDSGPPVILQDGFETSTAPGGGTCPTTAAQMPNAPRFSAGTTTPKAGSYSPFVTRLSREDGSQEIKGLNVTLPPGLTGRLAGTPSCPEALIAQAMARSKPGQGALELASPSCPAASQVGTVEVSAGAGPVPYRTAGKAYLAGPYKGAPVSLVVITPAVAGPFDLGTVVIRNPLYIDPVTTLVTVKSDPIPTILEGIPLDVRSIEVKVAREQFTLNPTNCSPFAFAATAFGISSDAALSARFQVGECAALKFKPDLKLQLHGGTKRGDYQRLTATVNYPGGGSGYANISRAAVTLPHSSFLAQEHIRTVCTRVQFAVHACPTGSIYGHATATTPLLDEPLSGPVYLRSSNNLLPDLVVVLRGPDSRPIEVELAGRTDSKDGGIRNTFDFVPDAPVSKFTLQLQGGKKSLIVNSRDLCKSKKQRATVRLSAQNGMQHNFRTVVGNDCGKKKGKKHGKH
jgi:hypothetical protein